MMPAIALDLEITNRLESFSQWRQYRPLGISCLAIVGTHSRQVFVAKAPQRILEERALDVVHFLYDEYFCKGYTIVSFNGLAFDFVVLADNGGAEALKLCREMALSSQHIDLMFNAYMALGYNVSLDTACQETCGVQKLGFANGAEAPIAWHDGRHKEVVEYCKHDALITFQLHQALLEEPRLKWRTRGGKGQPRQLLGNGTWQPTWSVARMLEKEPPEIPRWMKNNPITLKSFLENWNE